MANRNRKAAPRKAKTQATGRAHKPRPAKRPAANDRARTTGGKAAGAGASAKPEPVTRSGPMPGERVPVVLESHADAGYALIDSGGGEKLERYGPYRIVRPEAQALWPKRLADAVWQAADAVFTGDTEEDGMGRWFFPHTPLGETWPMRLAEIDFLGRFTAFRHVGVFPEQAAHWRWLHERIAGAGRPLKVLNLFGYTGVASLVAARAGARVTHVDASKKAIGWARENQAQAGLGDKPVRWICDDAMKFIRRETRRDNRYDIILADPPKFGRGPTGEVWQLFEELPAMLNLCRDLLSDDPEGLVLTAYSIRASFYSMHGLMRETMRGAGGHVESGELIIREAGERGDETEAGRALSTSLFSRWVPA